MKNFQKLENKDLIKTNQILIFSGLIITGLYFGASLLIPFTFGVLFATLVLPVSNLLEKKMNLGRVTSSFISTLLVFIVVGLFSFFLIRQFGIFLGDIIESRDEIMAYIQHLQEQLAESTGFLMEQQQQMFQDRLMDLVSAVQKFLSSFLGDITGILLNFLLILVYTFLFLLNRKKLIDFVMMYVSDEKEEGIRMIIHKTSKVAHGYLWGRIQVMLALAIMYGITFTAYGLEYSILLILFGTLITIIPYLGPFLSGILPVIFMIIYGDSALEIVSFALIVLIIQLLESYFFEPVLIGYEVEQSPLFVIIAVLLGGALWGPSGLILFVPIFAIIKILFDHSPSLKPVGFLISYERPGAGESFLEKIKRKLRF